MKPEPNGVCEITPRTTPCRALLVFTGLLMPGGALLLVWMLCRRFFPRLSGPLMQRFVLLLLAPLLIVFLQGCTTQMGSRCEAPRDGETTIAAPALRFQNPSAAPEGASALVGPDALRPGDILLTSMPGIAAAI